jgi:transcriptional regulator with XRE-family HTH domain
MEPTPQSEKTIGQKIKDLRKKQDMTQEGLARKADIPYTTLVKIEGDAIQNPTLDTLTKIVSGLGISLDELINS